MLVADEYRALNVLADRRGMKVAVNGRVSPEMPVHLLRFDPVAALEAGRPIMDTFLDCFSPGFPLSQNPIAGNSADPCRGILSGFGISEFADDEIADGPRPGNKSQQLHAQASWVHELPDGSRWSWEQFPQVP